MENVLKETKNMFTCVGTVYEKKLEMTNVEIEAGPKDNKKKVKTDCIKGSVVVKIPSGTVTFPVYATKIGYNGKDNFKWNMFSAMRDEWIPKVGGKGEEPTRVIITGNFNINDYVGRDGSVSSDLQYRINTANTRVTEDMTDGFNIKFTGFINKMMPEIKNEEETGRLKVEFLCVDYNGKCYPVNCIAEAESVELLTEGDSDFEPFAPGQTRRDIEAEYTVVSATPTVTVEPTKVRSFRKNNGPKVEAPKSRDQHELVLYSATEAAVEKPEELTYTNDDGEEVPVETDWINPKTMKEAIKIRNEMLEEKKNNPPADKKSNPANSLAAMKAKAKSMPSWTGDDDDDIF